jgi:hypothetical protein
MKFRALNAKLEPIDFLGMLLDSAIQFSDTSFAWSAARAGKRCFR